MNAGAIAISSELVTSGDKSIINAILDWVEVNVKDQKMFIDRKLDLTYIIGNSALFDASDVPGTYEVYHLIIEKAKIMVYKTGSSIQL
jgi:hypothetical protein